MDNNKKQVSSTIQVSFSLPLAYAKILKQAAFANGLSVSAFLRELVIETFSIPSDE